MILLVRHAHAGDKAAWTRPDRERPLSAPGLQEADGLVTRLGGFDITQIVSSPAVRCVQTVEGLAHARQLPVLTDPGLGTDGDLTHVLGWVFADDAASVLLCTHGEIIGALLTHLRERSAPIDNYAEWPKGSTWLLDTRGGEVTEAAYLPPLRTAVAAG